MNKNRYLKPDYKKDVGMFTGLTSYWGIVHCVDNNNKKIYSVKLGTGHLTKKDALENAKWHIENWI